MVFFFDLPVYRLSEAKYQAMLDSRIADQVANWHSISGSDPDKALVDRMSQSQYEKYGSWQFNEIIAYIRLYFLGKQIRGEYFSAERAGQRLGRLKVFTFRSYKLAPEINLTSVELSENEAIWADILRYIDRCGKELRKGRLIDDRQLKLLGPHVDWRAVIGNNLQGL